MVRRGEVAAAVDRRRMFVAVFGRQGSDMLGSSSVIWQNKMEHSFCERGLVAAGVNWRSMDSVVLGCRYTGKGASTTGWRKIAAALILLDVVAE